MKRVCILSLLLSGLCAGQHYCEADQALAEKIRGESAPPEMSFQQSREFHRKHLAKLLAEFPTNFWIRQAYIDAAKDNMRAPDETAAQAKAWLDSRAEDPESRFLYAVALIGRQTPDATKILDQLLADRPDFALAHLRLTDIHSYPAFKDDAKMRSHVEAFLRKCPDAVAGYVRATRLGNSEFLREYTRKARQHMDGKTDRALIPQYRFLWNLEFKVTPVPEHAKVREQVRKDIDLLKKVEGKDAKFAESIVAEGRKILGEKDETAVAAKPKPEGDISKAFEAMNAWDKKNPYPKPDDGEEKKQTYFEAKLAASDEWIQHAPADAFLYLQKLQALAELPKRPEEELTALADKILEMDKARTSNVRTGTPLEMTVARAYAKRGVRLDRVPEMVAAGLAKAKADAAKQNENDLMGDPKNRAREEQSNWYVRKSAASTLIETYLQLKKPEEARRVAMEQEVALGEWRKKVAEWRAAVDAHPKDKPKSMDHMIMEMSVKSLPMEEAQVLEKRAEIAERENHKLDALTFYQSAMRFDVGENYKKNLMAKAQKAWKDLGGTTEAWQLWEKQLEAPAAAATAKKPEGSWNKIDRALPEFQVSDLKGASWTKASLSGKTVFINLWATWCGPCREELPHLEKLHQKMKDREDVLLITLNLDESIGLVEPYMKENKYTFPVLFAKEVVEGFLGAISIPRNWVVDRSGLLKFEGIGFGGEGGEDWIRKMSEKVESVRTGS